jgi:peptidoglycan/LPS O-acetylase OafA/YrhL
MAKVLETIKTEYRLPGLDGIRALAILMVLFAHFIPKSTSNIVLKTLSQNGGYGVEIFFVLSGFLITSLIIREEQKTNIFSIRNFYIRRTVRIFPPLITYLFILIFLTYLGSRKITGLDFTVSLLFLRNYFGECQSTEHIWTLSIEEQYYIFLPLIFILFKDNKNRLIFLICTVSILSPWRQYCCSMPETNWRRTDLKFEPLLLGSIIAILRNSLSSKILTNGFFSSVWAVLFSLAIIALSYKATKYDGLGLNFIRISAVYISIGLIINALASGKVTLISSILTIGPIVWLGRISYSLYLWQQLFSPFDNRTDYSWYTLFPQNILLAFCTGSLSFYCIEVPINKIRSKLLHGN